MQKKYQDINKTFRNAIREDTRYYLDRHIEEAQDAADKKEIGAVYKITRNVTSTNFSSNTAIIKNRSCRTLPSNKKTITKVCKHFNNSLNRNESHERWPANRRYRHQLHIEKGDITCQDIEKAIQQNNNNKIPGKYHITA